MNDISINKSLYPLFNPRSVAVIGATNLWNKWGFSTFSSVLNGFEGQVFPVNSTEAKVLGRRAYKRVSDIPDDEPVDLAVFVIPAKGVPGVMEDCVEKGVKAAVIISAGFAEVGEEGKILQDRVVEIARKGDIRFIGPNCMGYWSASSNLRAFMFPLPVREGPIAFVSQGGNVGGTVVQMGFHRGLGFQRYISCGCAADIQIEDYIEHFGNDERVKVILAYIEGLNDGKRFIDKVSKVTMKKPVIVLKPGKTEAGTVAISSHSGALAGSNELYDSAFHKAGVIRVNTAELLLDSATGFLTQPLPKGRNVAIITPGGSYGVISADACASLGLNLIKLSPETIEQFNQIFPPRWSHGNPVDPAGDRDFIAYLTAPEVLLKLNEVDSMIFMGFDSFSTFSAVFAGINDKLTGTLRKLFGEISARIPYDSEESDSNDAGWMDKLIRKIIEVFFSFFGTSDQEGIERFVEKLITFIHKGRIKGLLERRLKDVFRAYQVGGEVNVGGLFEQLFEPLLQVLSLIWIDTYKKPLISTSFMGTASTVTDLNYYAYPFAENAALVLAKMVEYREYLDRAD